MALPEPTCLGSQSEEVLGPTLLTSRFKIAEVSKPELVASALKAQQAGERTPAPDSDSEAEEDEQDVGPPGRRAAREKAARDEEFWTAAQKALDERERRERVGAFLKEHGFSSVNEPKRGTLWWNYTYPLHLAAKLGDLRLIELLLRSGAVRRQRDSSGRTARHVARQENLWHSHDAVIRFLWRERRNGRPTPHTRAHAAGASGQPSEPPAVAAAPAADIVLPSVAQAPWQSVAVLMAKSSKPNAGVATSPSDTVHPAVRATSVLEPPCEQSVPVLPAKAGGVRDACTQCVAGQGEGGEPEQP